MCNRVIMVNDPVANRVNARLIEITSVSQTLINLAERPNHGARTPEFTAKIFWIRDTGGTFS